MESIWDRYPSHLEERIPHSTHIHYVEPLQIVTTVAEEGADLLGLILDELKLDRCGMIVS